MFKKYERNYIRKKKRSFTSSGYMITEELVESAATFDDISQAKRRAKEFSLLEPNPKKKTKKIYTTESSDPIDEIVVGWVLQWIM